MAAAADDLARRLAAFIPLPQPPQKEQLSGVAAAVLDAGGRLGRAVGDVFRSLRIDEGLDVALAQRHRRKRGRTSDVESSVVARGDLWRAEASHSSAAAAAPPLFMVQLGPVLFVRDTTLLFPVHLSKRHLIWYGFERKNGVHSVCPAYWSAHRRWFFMSMICLNPFTCNRSGGSITPMVQWPDKSFSLGTIQTLSWKRCGLMLQPALQFSICPTFGGSRPGLSMELIHSVNENAGVVCGYSHTASPSAYASISIGRSKLNGSAASSGLVLRVDAPLHSFGRPWFSIQMNSGLEF
ncbi:hypothetical protein OsJ_20161 [Oryza sativa Japonica Group]|uniref:Uncharacterized protein n=1 Tax=Oryza sativa subsp. japonica TaxID=39947 RepID=B9FRJ4_ORYSJ|nr:hypothetical protein OsJ_20161 [Oryza sativa Japonica Group]